jgi:hypothetical protein
METNVKILIKTKQAKTTDEANGIEEKYKDYAHGCLQWKGTAVCMDIYCKCGHQSHIDEEFTYYIKCPNCETVYYCNPHIEFIEITESLPESESNLIKEPQQ